MVMLFVLVLVPTIVSASYLKDIGDNCIIGAECKTGWCDHVCIEDPCTDGVCDYALDCTECELVDGKMGDCEAADCGFEASKCFDEICEPYFDCNCDNYGDCEFSDCETENLIYWVIPVLILTVALVYYVKEVKK